MHLKESAYNFIYDDLGKDQIVFYNSRTGALAVVHLRINVDIKNIELANEVVSHLKQENMLEYIHPYLGLVIPYNGTYEADTQRCRSRTKRRYIRIA